MPPKRPAAAPPLLIDAPFGRIRSLRPSDVDERLLAWFADPEIMRAINLAPQPATKPEMRRYVEAFDNRTKMILGIFDTRGKLVGLVLGEMSPRHRSIRISLLTGDRSHAARRVIVKGLPVFFDGLFEKRGIEKIAAHVTECNEVVGRALERAGMQREGHLRGNLLAADGARRLDQTLYGLLKADRAPQNL